MLAAYQQGSKANVLKLANLKNRPIVTVGLAKSATVALNLNYNCIVVLPELLDLELAQNFDTLVSGCSTDLCSHCFRFNSNQVNYMSVFSRSTPPPDILNAFIKASSRILNLGQLDIYLQCDPVCLSSRYLLKIEHDN